MVMRNAASELRFGEGMGEFMTFTTDAYSRSEPRATAGAEANASRLGGSDAHSNAGSRIDSDAARASKT